MANASVALDQARALLNDVLGTVWTNALLMPKLYIAHQELQLALWEAGSPVVRAESSTILVDIAATTLGASQPADMLAPTKLIEYDWATGPVYSNPVDMTEVFFIPKGEVAALTLKWWCWRKETIMFLGSSAKRGVVVQYRKLLTIPTVVDSALGISFAELYCGPRVAALAAGSVGNAAVLTAATEMASVNFARVISANRGQQKAPDRP